MLTYDGNGNQLAGLDGKVMAYDRENRPTQVTIPAANKRTCYIYGADGARLKKIEGFDAFGPYVLPLAARPGGPHPPARRRPRPRSR